MDGSGKDCFAGKKGQLALQLLWQENAVLKP